VIQQMKESHSLALIVAFYLSRYDLVAYDKLGYPTNTTTHKEIGKALGVKPNSVKNMRDEFDPLHNNRRVGWYQRPLRPSRAKVVESFGNLTEEEMFDVVLEILTNPSFSSSDAYAEIVQPISKQAKSKRGLVFVPRGITGRLAEEFFITNFKEKQEPVSGELRDTRELGCGFDFEIRAANQKYQVEVKGLDGESGGISFTSKEWNVAREFRDSFYVGLVRNLSTNPYIQFIQNPAKIFNATKRIYTSVQVQWNVAESTLRSI